MPRLSPKDEPEYLTTSEVAKMLRCKPQTLRRRRSEGRGPAFVKFSQNRVLYRLEVVRDFMRANEFESVADEAACAALRAASIG